MYKPPTRLVPNYYKSRVLLLRMKRWPSQPTVRILHCKVIKREEARRG